MEGRHSRLAIIVSRVRRTREGPVVVGAREAVDPAHIPEVDMVDRTVGRTSPSHPIKIGGEVKSIRSPGESQFTQRSLHVFAASVSRHRFTSVTFFVIIGPCFFSCLGKTVYHKRFDSVARSLGCAKSVLRESWRGMQFFSSFSLHY